MQEAAHRIAAAIGPGAFDGDAYALLVSVYKDLQHAWELRVDAAKVAVSHEKPALASSTVAVVDPLAAMSVEHMQALHRIALAAAEAEQAG